MKSVCLFVASVLALTQPRSAMAWQAISHCYKILVDGKDRSSYQYVNSRFITFADPAWKQDPTVDEAHLVDPRTGKEEKAPFIQRANYLPSRLWGGVMFEHIPFGKILTLRIGTSRVTIKRTDFDVACPHLDFRLDDRQNGYEILQYCPYEAYIGLGPLGSHVHVEGGQVIIKTVLLFTDCSASLTRSGDGKSEPFPVKWVSGAQLTEQFPQLGTRIREDWGFLNTYLLIPPLNRGDELNVTVTLPGEGQRLPFYLRKIE